MQASHAASCHAPTLRASPWNATQHCYEAEAELPIDCANENAAI